MALLNNTLSEREKAALYYHLFTGCKDWREIYLIATDQPINEARKDVNLSAYSSRWKTSGKVQDFLAMERDKRAVWEARERERIEQDIKSAGESVRKDGKQKTGFVDYSNPENQRKKLNELVNSANDPGEALDALKVIISGQKDDRQAAREQKQVRAYLPLTCQDCPLYQKVRK